MNNMYMLEKGRRYSLERRSKVKCKRGALYWQPIYNTFSIRKANPMAGWEHGIVHVLIIERFWGSNCDNNVWFGHCEYICIGVINECYIININVFMLTQIMHLKFEINIPRKD